MRFGLCLILLPIAIFDYEKPLLCNLPHLQLGFHYDTYTADFCPEYFLGQFGFDCFNFIDSLGGYLSEEPATFLGGEQYKFAVPALP